MRVVVLDRDAHALRLGEFAQDGCSGLTRATHDEMSVHGIDAFLFDWYNYEGQPFLEGALNNGFLKAGNRDRLRFALMWANHTWTDLFPAKELPKPICMSVPGPDMWLLDMATTTVALGKILNAQFHGRTTIPADWAMARTNLVYTGTGRQLIFQKLNDIRFPEVLLDGLPLSEVIKFLNDEVKKQDPLKRGINFMLNSFVDAGGAAGPVTVDPATGAAIPSAPVEPINIETVTIKINPALVDIRLADLMDAIIKVADKPAADCCGSRRA